MWLDCAIPCPVCGGVTERTSYGDGGTNYESDERCKSCPWWYQSFSYGYNEERIGFCDWDWSWMVTIDEDLRRVRERQIALEEMRRILAHPDFLSMCKAPIGVLSDWLEDHDFPVNGRASRQFEYVPSVTGRK